MIFLFFFFFKQKTAYEIVDCDWSSDVCSSDLTDVYFYWADLIPYWRSLMLSPPEQSADILHSALAHIQTLQGAAQIGRASCRERV